MEPPVSPPARSRRCGRPPARAGLGRLALLDSAMRHDTLGRHSYLAAAPFGTFRARDAGRPGTARRCRPAPRCPAGGAAPYRIEADPDLPPFQGGAIAIVALRSRREPGAGGGAGPARRPRRRSRGQPLRHGRRLRPSAGTCRLIATGFSRDRARRPGAPGRARPRRPGGGPEPPAPRARPPRSHRSPGARTSRPRPTPRAVDGCGLHPGRGHLPGQHRPALRATLPPGFDAFAFYRRLRARNPATFAAYLEGDGLTLASSSPERFLRLDRRAVETRPIKGTARRADDPAQDRARAEALAADPKERAENVMIVDLLRNDLSRICAPHSVAVPTLCGIETYAGVHHLVSAVTGTLKEGADGLDLLAATFPAARSPGAEAARHGHHHGDRGRCPRGLLRGDRLDRVRRQPRHQHRDPHGDARRHPRRAPGRRRRHASVRPRIRVSRDLDQGRAGLLGLRDRGRAHDPRRRQLRFLRLQRGALPRGAGRNGPVVRNDALDVAGSGRSPRRPW